MSPLSQVFLAPEVHAAACRGERAACRAVYESVAGPVFGLACRLVGRTAAEDVFQDTMMRTFERLADYRAEAPFGMWVRAIAVNAALTHLRSPWRRLRGLVDELGAALESAAPEGPLVAGGAPQAAIDVERLLARLPPVARTVLWLHDIEGYSHEDIALAFGRTPSFSKSQLSRAHARLREFAGDGDGYSDGVARRFAAGRVVTPLGTRTGTVMGKGAVAVAVAGPDADAESVPAADGAPAPSRPDPDCRASSWPAGLEPLP